METARELIERCRWPDGVACPRCAGQARRLGTSELFQCGDCRAQFSLTAGTVLEHSRVPLEGWVAAIGSACLPAGVNAEQVQILTGVTYKSAVSMMRRLRDASERAGIGRRSFRLGHQRRLSFAPLPVEEVLRALLQLRPETSDERLDRAWAELTGEPEIGRAHV